MVLLWCLMVVVIVVVLCDGLPILVSRGLKLGVTTRHKPDRAVYLTFDDGPDPKYTPLLLDVLHASGVKATFFVIAERAIRYPDIVRRMVSEGHQVELHGYTHACVPLLSPMKSARQVIQSYDTLQSVFGLTPSWYRPTWGLINVFAWEAAIRKRIRFITWSVMVGDWRVTPPDELRDRVLKRLVPGDVIVLHDSDETFGSESGAPINVIAMIPDLVTQVTQRGIQFELLNQTK